MSMMPEDVQQQFAALPLEQQMSLLQSYVGKSMATYDGNLELLGVADVNTPFTVSISF